MFIPAPTAIFVLRLGEILQAMGDRLARFRAQTDRGDPRLLGLCERRQKHGEEKRTMENWNNGTVE